MRHQKHQRPNTIALTALAVVATAACGSSGAQPAPRAAVSTVARAPLTTTQSREFVSQRYHFGLSLPATWSEQEARMDWDGRMLQGLHSPAFTNVTDPTTNRTLVAAAAPVVAGTRLTDWRAAMVRAAPSVCTESPTAERTTLDGEPALEWTNSCSDGFQARKLASVHGELGYIVFLASSTGNDHAADQRVFESARRSFRFTA